MFDEEIAKKEVAPEEPILYHGTISTRFESFRQPDGSYKNPNGDPIWLDEEGQVPGIRAEEDHEATGADEILLFVRTGRIKTKRAPNVSEVNERNIKRNKFWIVDSLPADSYVSYNLTKDPLGLRSNDVQPDPKAKPKIIAEICKPLEKVPTVIRLILAQPDTLNS